MKTPLRFGSAGNGIRTPVLLISGSSRYHWTARAPLKLDELTLLEEVLLIHSDDCFCWFIIHYAHLPPWDLNCWPQYSRVFCPGLLFRAPSSCQLSVCWRSLLLVLPPAVSLVSAGDPFSSCSLGVLYFFFPVGFILGSAWWWS